MKILRSVLIVLAIGAATISTANARDSFSIGINVGGFGNGKSGITTGGADKTKQGIHVVGHQQVVFCGSKDMGDGLLNQSAATDFSIAAIMARTVVAQQQRNAAAAMGMGMGMGMAMSTAASE